MARRQQRDNKPNLTPLYAFMGITITAILVAAFAFRERKTTQAEQRQSAAPGPRENPFADLDSAPPPRRSSSSKPFARKGKPTDLAPATILTERIWVEASANAKLALEFLSEAETAKSNQRLVLFEQKAIAGRELLDEQLVNTADWEEKLFELYGDNDRIASQIRAERNRWFKKVGKYRTVGTTRKQ